MAVKTDKVELGEGGVYPNPATAGFRIKPGSANKIQVKDATHNWVDLDTVLGTAIPVPTTEGGTGLSSYTLGDLIYASATNVLAKLAGNATTTKKFLRQTGNGSVSAAPAWDTLVAGDLPSHNHSAADLTSGTVPDARFPSTLPALNGSALTNLNGTNVASGTVADARLSANVADAITKKHTQNTDTGTNSGEFTVGLSPYEDPEADLILRGKDSLTATKRLGLRADLENNVLKAYDFEGAALADLAVDDLTADTIAVGGGTQCTKIIKGTGTMLDSTSGLLVSCSGCTTSSVIFITLNSAEDSTIIEPMFTQADTDQFVVFTKQEAPQVGDVDFNYCVMVF